MKRLALYMTSLVPGITFAHPGHTVTEHLHALLHGEHLLLLISIVVVAGATSVIINKFR